MGERPQGRSAPEGASHTPERPNLGSSPIRLLSLNLDQGPFQLFGQLVSEAMRLAAPIHKGVSSGVLIAVPNLVARLSGYPKLLTQTAHGLPIQQPRYESHSLVHHTGLLPWHLWVPPKRSLMCYLCVRNNLLPISRNGHSIS